MRRLKRLWIFWLLAGIGMCSLGGTILAWVVRGGDLAATISAVSAALSALAILGVVVALYFQIQQTEIARVDALMTHRSELLMFAIGEPELLVSWGFDPSGNASVAKLQAYATPANESSRMKLSPPGGVSHEPSTTVIGPCPWAAGTFRNW